jgi:hypothetical protein
VVVNHGNRTNYANGAIAGLDRACGFLNLSVSDKTESNGNRQMANGKWQLWDLIGRADFLTYLYLTGRNQTAIGK